MKLLGGLSLRAKLGLLAGVPVLGALALASLIAVTAQRQAVAAASLGSMEGVAQLSLTINGALYALQVERAAVALQAGSRRNAPDDRGVPALPARAPPGPDGADRDGVDRARLRLDAFLTGRDLSKFPARLARDLVSARERIAGRAAFLARAGREDVALEDILTFYGRADDALASATAALTELSEDGELLRRVSSLVALSQLAERASIEHALLAYVFARGEFPPGEFKYFVTLSTEQDVYEAAFRASAGPRELADYDALVRSSATVRVNGLREAAVRATDDNFAVDPSTWYAADQERLSRLEDIQRNLLAEIARLATGKMEAIRAAVRLGLGLSAAVVIVSGLLGWLISRGVTRGIVALSTAAVRVQTKKDFSTRVERTSDDELGQLTDAFNAMLSAIEQRDADLEGQVAARTSELRRTVAELWSEMDLARKVQTVLLPGALDLPGYRMAARMVPAATVGGDYYDVLRMGEADWILIGDVSGHGVTAGLSMMIVQTAVRTLIQSAAAEARPLRPSQLLSQVNAAVRSNLSKIHANQYMTIMALKLEGTRVTFSGLHQDLLVYRAASKSVERIVSRGIWIGLIDDISALVEDDGFELQPGDLLLLYTDGVTETVVDGGRPGTSGVAVALRSLAGTNPDPAAVVEGILRRADDRPFEDDATVVAALYDSANPATPPFPAPGAAVVAGGPSSDGDPSNRG